MTAVKGALCAVIVVVLCAGSAQAAVTALGSYDSTTDLSYTLDPDYDVVSTDGAGALALLPGGPTYPAGNPAFAGAIDVSPSVSQLLQATGAEPIGTTLNYAAGTVEMWVASDNAGVGQGGDGVAGPAPGDARKLFGHGGGIFDTPFSLLFFNNGWPTDGGQVFARWHDGTQDFWAEHGTWNTPENTGIDHHGSTYNWLVGEWHHIAFSWDLNTLGLYLDGVPVKETARTNVNPNMFDGTEQSLFGAVGGGAGFDGQVDDFTISSHAKYTPDAGGPYLPDAPNVPEPATMGLLALGGLAALRRRRR